MQIFPDHRRVVAGVDGSPNSLAAAAAECRHARLDLYHVLPERRPAGLMNTATEWLRLRSLVARELPASKHPMTRLHIAHGAPAEALLKAARRADLLVIEAREHCEYGNPLGAPTVPAVLSGAPCEVVICEHHAAPAAQNW